jgi:acyl carrier protein
MGGHSILATRLVSAIRKEFNLNMPIKLVFEFTTIKQLGDYIKLALSSFEKPDEDSDIFEL